MGNTQSWVLAISVAVIALVYLLTYLAAHPRPPRP